MASNKPSTAYPNIARIALYARVSTHNGQDPEMQLVELRQYAAHRGFLISEEYVDRGVSGAKESRPALNRLMSDAQRRKFDGVLVWKLDRFGRSLKHLVNSLAQLESLGVAFISLRDNLDLTTPSGRLMFQVIGAMAEFERSLIAERVKAGIHHAQQNGVHVGRPKGEVNLSHVAALRASGASWRIISKKTGIPVGTLYRVAHSERSKTLPESAVANA